MRQINVSLKRVSTISHLILYIVSKLMENIEHLLLKLLISVISNSLEITIYI